MKMQLTFPEQARETLLAHHIMMAANLAVMGDIDVDAFMKEHVDGTDTVTMNVFIGFFKLMDDIVGQIKERQENREIIEELSKIPGIITMSMDEFMQAAMDGKLPFDIAEQDRVNEQDKAFEADKVVEPRDTPIPDSN